jgi:hypothetical protein
MYLVSNFDFVLPICQLSSHLLMKVSKLANALLLIISVYGAVVTALSLP